MEKVTVYITALILLLFSLSSGECGLVAGLPEEEAFRLGERMYREGILPSGEPMQAVVERSIIVDGNMFTCVSCHLRSGLGAVEGTVISPQINAPKLFNPLRTGVELVQRSHDALPEWILVPHKRPAYTSETLGKALRDGVDPTGREFDPIMPRYPLSERDMEIMVHYLRSLSAELSPGVTEQTIRFATVVSEGVSPEDRKSLAGTLKGYFDSINAQSRHQGAKKTKGVFWEEQFNRSFRTISLSIWELKGPRDTWKAQLKEYYRKEPVFALVSGIVEGSWEPVHRFSEEHKIPSLFPLTDLPVISEKDWYTVYFSQGLYQEGVAVARYLNRFGKSDGLSVVQVYREDEEGAQLARGLKENWKGPEEALKTVILSKDERLTEGFWKELSTRHKESIFVLWLHERDIPTLKVMGDMPERPSLVFLSASLMNGKLGLLPERMRGFTYITYPYRLPKDYGYQRGIVQEWLKIRGIPVMNLELQLKVFSFTRILTETVMEMENYFYRDFFLDAVDSLRDQTYTVATYPRLSFGPGQRYASKGCYIVKLSEGPEPEVTSVSDWVIH